MISPSISNMSLPNKQKVKVCHRQESISSMKREMMRAGLIEELLDEGMEEMVSWRCVNV